MPELPEVETTKNGLLQLINQTLYGIDVYNKSLRFDFPIEKISYLRNQKLKSLSRYGKYLLFYFSNDYLLLSHLGMSGRFKVLPLNTSREKHDHICINFNNKIILTYNDPRRFGFMDIFHNSEKESNRFLKVLGLDAIHEPLDAKTIHGFFQKKSAPIKNVLLDQSLITGIGNIYACEALYWSGISPFRSANALNLKEVESLLKNIQKVLQEAISAGGSSLKNFQHTDGKLGYFQKQWAVYGKDDKPCPKFKINDQTTHRIIQKKLAGRSTFYCPKCQN